MDQVVKTRIGMTEHAWQIARIKTAESGCKSLSEWLEWIVLSQKYSASEAAKTLGNRAKRGRVKKLSEKHKSTY